MLVVVRSSIGSEFHNLGPAILKALSPQLFVLERGTFKIRLPLDRKDLPAESSKSHGSTAVSRRKVVLFTVIFEEGLLNSIKNPV